RRALGQLVGDLDADLVTLGDPDLRTRRDAVVGPCLGVLARRVLPLLDDLAGQLEDLDIAVHLILERLAAQPFGRGREGLDASLVHRVHLIDRGAVDSVRGAAVVVAVMVVDIVIVIVVVVVHVVLGFVLQGGFCRRWIVRLRGYLRRQSLVVVVVTAASRQQSATCRRYAQRSDSPEKSPSRRLTHR